MLSFVCFLFLAPHNDFWLPNKEFNQKHAKYPVVPFIGHHLYRTTTTIPMRDLVNNAWFLNTYLGWAFEDYEGWQNQSANARVKMLYWNWDSIPRERR